MKFQEYQTKQIFKDAGIPVLPGKVVASPEEAQKAANLLGGVVAVKAQVLVGGRGKAGGIKIAKSPEDAATFASTILANPLKGLTVHKLLIEQGAAIAREFYLGFAVDRTRKAHTLIFTAQGGVDVEELAATNPSAIITLPIYPSSGLTESIVQRVLTESGLQPSQQSKLVTILKKLYEIYIKSDAELIEINPLVVTESGDLIALDAKLSVDDSAAYRQPELVAMLDPEDEDPIETEAKKQGLAYVRLSGNVGIIGNGAGLVMGTMDEVQRAGGTPANFLDLGGGARADVMKKALELLLKDSRIKGVFINIFGGITRCDEVAKGIIGVSAETKLPWPIVIRLEGTQADEGKALLAASNLIPASSMQDGAKKIVELVANA